MSNTQSIEIELKYVLMPEQLVKTAAWLDDNAMFVGQKHLENLYFDTPEGLLNKHRIGLRIRRWPGGAEQTVKLAGVVDGAMSQRPEFNVPATQAVPDLEQFPADIWPANFETKAVTARLQLQFEVSFDRRYWLFEKDGTQIEVSIDEGKIHAGGKQESISELELELKQGSEETLTYFADLLHQHFELQAGEKSKAQRGYELLLSANES
ncbi:MULTISPECIES: inorganic triphosphatase [Gammaproteobacteria]|uniref:CYTH domain-containing protein n=1 Tax=Gammaproteobacteria TaxID=1236 RepID=UPI000DD033DE|nr:MULTISPECIES: CYTH domain-containing protein [Gammaproteobacteria]RTE87697.1 CYTH domain-containing protein [Aliidiomarina sp. B3213]TCZ92520.1 CYTH domain-containing protein [Lysobacter sp. N42]